jgi:hypothetical protein
MYPSSPALTATLHALHGESDVPIVAPALGDPWFACVLALAPGVDPVISALGALACGLPSLLPPGMTDSPALHAAIASLIGTDTGERILPTWATVAPVGWGASHAATLIDAVQHDRCSHWAAAALIGPSDNSAVLLTWSDDIACAVRRWGQATPNAPTAWMQHLTPAERNRLVDTLRRDPKDAACGLPWLPVKHAAAIIRSELMSKRVALAAYAEASPVAHARHAAILAALIQRAERYDLAALTRLAVGTGMDAAWAAVVQILREAPNDAVRVVAAAPWDALHPAVQSTILSAADHNAVCAAIAFARGVRPDPPAISPTSTPASTQDIAHAFFAAVTWEVLDALPEEKKRAWRCELDTSHISIAVRSLGAEPTLLAHAYLDDALIAAVRRHTPDEDAVRWMLFPVAVHDLPIADLPTVVAALPPPPDPVAFVHIAGGARKMPLPLRDRITAHPTPQTLGATITALHAAAKRGNPVKRCCALAHALAGWSWKETHALLDALPDDVCDALRPDPDFMANRLTLFHHRIDFIRALDSLAALPPSVAIPAYHAITTLATALHVGDRWYAGEGLAQALRAHGDRFLAIVDALAVEHQAKVLPVPDNETRDDIRALASADPPVAYRLAHALHRSDPAATLDALETAGAQDVQRLWRFMSDALRRTISGDIDALASAAAAPGRVDDLAQALRAWNVDDPLPLLALRMLIDDNEKRQAQGVAALARQTGRAATLLLLLRDDLRTLLESVPVIAFAGSDLPPSRSTTPTRRRR